MARKTNNKNQLSLFDLLGGSQAVIEPPAPPVEATRPAQVTPSAAPVKPGVALTYADIAEEDRTTWGGAGFTVEHHARGLSDEDLLTAYFEARDEFDRAVELKQSCSSAIYNGYLQVMVNRRMVDYDAYSAARLPATYDASTVVGWGNGSEKRILTYYASNQTPENDQQLRNYATDYERILVTRAGLAPQEAKERVEAEFQAYMQKELGGTYTGAVPATDVVKASPAPVSTAPVVTFDPSQRPPMPQSPLARAEANLVAIELLRTLEAENRPATAEEQKVLSLYSSWGACPKVFDRSNTEFQDVRDRLEALVAPEEYRRLAATTLTAFFTGQEITRPLWAALKAAGYTGGPVLEPGAGVGNFIGAAPDTAEMVGVEIDPIAASIASKLYPAATMMTQGFETFRPKDNSFIAAIGNVPFGDFQIYDPQHNPDGRSIHNHFIIKSLDLVKPGGYAAFVTSTNTCDARSQAAREDMAARADLISAVRLPNRAFSKAAGTDVASDVLVFRKRERGEEPTEFTKRFIDTDRLTLAEGSSLTVNGVFVDNPAAILGIPSLGRNQYGQPVLKVAARKDENLQEVLEARLVDDVSHQVDHGRGLTAQAEQVSSETIVADAAPVENVIPGTVRYIKHGGKVSFEVLKATTGGWENLPRSKGANDAEWVALIDLAETTTQLRQAYRTGEGDIAALQDRLNVQYDAYVSTYGPLKRFEKPKPRKPNKSQQTQKFNALVSEWRAANGEGVTAQPPAELVEQFRDEAAQPILPENKIRKHLGKLRQDPRISSLLAVEIFDETTQTAEKGRIFTGDPRPPAKIITSVDNLADGIAVSLHRFGAIDLAFIADLMDTTADEVETGVVEGGYAFRDPADPETFIRAEEYLSGLVRDKLADAIHAARSDERFAVNVTALEAVLPPRISEGIDIRPGVTWIPQHYYEQFISETFKIPESKFTLTNVQDIWALNVNREWWRDHGTSHDLAYGVVAGNNYNHSARYNYLSSVLEEKQFPNQGLATNRNDGTVVTAIDMMQAVLNVTSPTINTSSSWKKDHPDSPAVSKEATEFAQRRATALKEEFTRWVISDPARHNELIDAYNRCFNSFVPTKWVPHNLDIPGLSEKLTPYSYQRNAVERIVNEPAVLLNHVVGAGKTGTFLMGAAELKRLGKISQPWLVVPNHLAEQIASEANQWYPAAKVLCAAGLQGADERRQFVAQTTADDWDFVIVPESVFSLIRVSQDKEADYIQAQLDQLYDDLTAAKATDDHLTVKIIQQRIRQQENRLRKLFDSPRDPGVEFEATGCDYLIVDEAHNYKNLFRQSKVKDIAHDGSNRATDLDLKLTVLREAAANRPGHANPVVTFATGTPLANNLAEIWVMAHYLRPDLLDLAGVGGINAWAANFTEQITMAEVPPQGLGLRPTTRTASFINVGDLVGLCEPFMDVVTREQIEAKLPQLVGGTNTMVEFDLDQETRDFIIDISERANINWAELVTNGNPAAIDLALKQLSDGEKASMDPRLVNLDYEGFSPRIRELADNVARVWDDNKDNVYNDQDGKESPNKGAFQIIFLDQGTPKRDGSFNLYDQIKAACVERGMDPSRIAFIHDHDDDREELFEQCRNGGIDVLIGSTTKLGTGANIQTRAIALHHADIPWRPADVEQREGRILRQGNQNDFIHIFNCIARGSTDAVRWQTILRKTKTTDQFINADRSMRSMEPLEDTAETIAAQNRAAATGDSRYFDLMNLQKQVDDLEGRYQEWQATRESTKLARAHYTSLIARGHDFIASAGKVKDTAIEWAESESKTWTLPTGATTTHRDEAAAHVASVVRECLRRRDDTTLPLITIAGIQFEAHYEHWKSVAYIMPTNLTSHRDVQALTIEVNYGDMFIPDKSGKVTQAEYGLMTRIDNVVKRLPTTIDDVANKVAGFEIELKQLGDGANDDTFSRMDELNNAIEARNTLQAELAKIDQSEAAQAEKRARKARLDQKGRKIGWSLRLNPTPGYAKWVEHTTPAELVTKVKLEELDCMHSGGFIDDATYTARKAALTGHTQPIVIDHDDTPPTTPKQKPIEEMTPQERLAAQFGSSTPAGSKPIEEMTPQERLAAQFGSSTPAGSKPIEEMTPQERLAAQFGSSAQSPQPTEAERYTPAEVNSPDGMSL